MSKCSALFLLLLLVSSSSISEFVYASASPPKPTIPEFILKYIDYSHSVPPTYGTDPYTGERIITAQGHEIINRTVNFSIKNQPFTPYTDSNGATVGLYYHIQYKGHYENSWSGNSQVLDGRTTIYDTLVFPASDTEYTEISVVRYFNGGSDYKPLNYVPLPDEGSTDFQVQAIIGVASLETLKTTWSDVGPFYVVTGQMGDWSSTQTITVGDNTSTPAPNIIEPSLSPSESQSPTPTQLGPQAAVQPGDDWVQLAIVALLGVIAVLLSVAVALQLRRRKKRPQSTT